MATELGNQCTEFLHSYVPTIEGGQTVGLFCMRCGKLVRENMEHSGTSVDDTGMNFPATFFEEVKHQSTRDFKQQYHRKDPRF